MSAPFKKNDVETFEEEYVDGFLYEPRYGSRGVACTFCGGATIIDARPIHGGAKHLRECAVCEDRGCIGDTNVVFGRRVAVTYLSFAVVPDEYSKAEAGIVAARSSVALAAQTLYKLKRRALIVEDGIMKNMETDYRHFISMLI